ncbi:MAG: transglycosylase SLT domain-containing protein [Deltaproteobacteria bacterium]|nr:transglycosylase SLT domain-containing protein [Deltaproteobacteria bacterium]
MGKGKDIKTNRIKGLACAGLFAIMVFLPLPVLSGIYVMVDANGVYHFTNVPTSNKYKLYIRDRESSARTVLRAYTRNPAKYEPLINRYAKKYGVSKALIKAVIHAESDFNPYAVSKKGAQGLMQLMPETARDLSVQDVFDPEENIRAGVQYLKMLLKKFNGDLSLSLAAYNAGPNRVDQYGKVPPYRETKDYIKKVLTYYRMYR